MKRSPMRRRRGEARNSYARRARDFPFMAWIKAQRCLVSTLDPDHVCNGRSEADHIGDIGVRGLGMKCSDRETLPLCPSAHRDRHGKRGFFAGWSTADMRAWADEQIAKYQQLYADHLSGTGIELF